MKNRSQTNCVFKKQSLFWGAQVNYNYNVWGRNKSALENGLRQRICPLCNFEHLFLPEERRFTGKVLENGASAQSYPCSPLCVEYSNDVTCFKHSKEFHLSL